MDEEKEAVDGEDQSTEKVGKKPDKEVIEEIENKEKMLGLQSTLNKNVILGPKNSSKKGAGSLLTPSSQN